MKALVDGDIIVYRSAFAAEHTLYHVYLTEGGDDPSLWEFFKTFTTAASMKSAMAMLGIEDYAIQRELQVEPVENALYSAKHTLERIRRQTGADSVQVYLTGVGNFRDDVATLAVYKGNRKKDRKPKWYRDVREYLIKYQGAKVVNGIEADDALADAQANDTVICSIDKDLLQVPGKHYNWVKEKKVLVTPEQGHRLLWQQVLTGDSTDNIPGIKGLGAAKAKAMLLDSPDYYDTCVQAWDQALAEGKVQLITEEALAEGLNAQEVVDEIYRLVKVGTT